MLKRSVIVYPITMAYNSQAKLIIASAIAALNEWKIETNNVSVNGLSHAVQRLSQWKWNKRASEDNLLSL